MAEALSVNPEHKFINTTSGSFSYDILILTTGGKLTIMIIKNWKKTANYASS